MGRRTSSPPVPSLVGVTRTVIIMKMLVLSVKVHVDIIYIYTVCNIIQHVCETKITFSVACTVYTVQCTLYVHSSMNWQ